MKELIFRLSSLVSGSLGDVWEQLRDGAAQEVSAAVIAAGAIGLISNGVYVAVYRCVRSGRMRSRFVKAHASPNDRCFAACGDPAVVAEHDRDAADWIPNPRADTLLDGVLRSGTFAYVITGECGCGKSSCVRRALLRSKLPFVYANLRCETDSGGLVTQLAEAVDFKFDERVTWLNRVAEQLLGFDPVGGRSEEGDSDWRRLSTAIETVAEDVLFRTGKKATLVIDNLQRLVDVDGDDETPLGSRAVARVADWAAACADDGGPLRVIFAVPHGHELRRLFHRRALSRLQICNLPAVSHDRATDWLVAKTQADPAAAADFVRKVGGLPLALQRAADLHRTLRMPLQNIEDGFFCLGVSVLQQWDLLGKHGGQDAGAAREAVWGLLVRLLEADEVGGPPERLPKACSLMGQLQGEGTKRGVGVCALSGMPSEALAVVERLIDASVISAQGGRLLLHSPPVRVAVGRISGQNAQQAAAAAQPSTGQSPTAAETPPQPRRNDSGGARRFKSRRMGDVTE
eukprot:TRINITY_DN9570_c0_g1_i2.p1 TRINITY_DN9570_c0_g1~~TRINITY_DN9570_c0_g1_i2.p1  ORF type:complete len:516 (+),score=139.45 TRINITY_DN9570_c0_g1_i2:84-1631(+)